MRKLIYGSLLMLGIAGFTLTGCKKEDADESTIAAQDNVLAENSFADAFAQVDEVAKNSEDLNGAFRSSGGCPTVTITPAPPDTTFPKTVIIDFGDSCERNGRVRKGKIKAVFSGRYRKPGTVVTITFEDYYVNNKKIEGTKTVTNNGRNTAGNLSFTVKVEKSKIFDDGKTVSWESERTNEWIQGENTADWQDDVYSITGSASGTHREGKTFTATIKEALIKKMDCRWIVKGKLELKPEDKPARTIDYGDGTCDNKATVTIGSRTFDITLK